MSSNFGMPTTPAHGERQRIVDQLPGAWPVNSSCAKSFMAITPMFLRTATGSAVVSKLGLRRSARLRVGGVERHQGAIEIVPLERGLRNVRDRCDR